MLEKLILTYNWGGEPCGGTSYIPFEYKGDDKTSAKEKFVYDILEKFKQHK